MTDQASGLADRKNNYEEIENLLGGRKKDMISVQPFIERMDLAYSAADVIISRAGAGTISELCLAGKPVILVPSPNVAGDHQTRNAMALAWKDAAVMLSDKAASGRACWEALNLFPTAG